VLLRLPLALAGQSFATSLVFSQAATLELTYEVDDGSGVSISQPVVVSIGDVLQGDINGDGRVNLIDLAILQSSIGLTSGASAAQGDWNGDGAVDRADVAILLKNLGRSLAAPSQAASPSIAPPARVVTQTARSAQSDVPHRRMSRADTPAMRRRENRPAALLTASSIDRAMESLSAESAPQPRATLRARRSIHRAHGIQAASRTDPDLRPF
jgi:uncharacterized protein (DUF2141 family)